ETSLSNSICRSTRNHPYRSRAPPACGRRLAMASDAAAQVAECLTGDAPDRLQGADLRVHRQIVGERDLLADSPERALYNFFRFHHGLVATPCRYQTRSLPGLVIFATDPDVPATL